MTDLPDTDTLKGLLAAATPGPWCVADECVVWTQINDPIETTYDIGYPIAEARRQKSFWNGTQWPEGQPEANARLISLAPPLAARVIEQDAEIERLRIALHEASDPDMIRAALGAVGTMDEPGDDNPWRQVASLRAVLWSIAHAAKIETKEDLMMAAANALPMQFRPRIARAALEDWQ